jgi:hypothetical protein
MSNKQKLSKKDKNNQPGNPIKPDPETLHTPDPQEQMEGPVSSLMHKTGEQFDAKESKKHADQRKDQNL